MDRIVSAGRGDRELSGSEPATGKFRAYSSTSNVNVGLCAKYRTKQ